ncbi:MAG: hypothetical protein WBW04_18895 [Nitrolancea sp.]
MTSHSAPSSILYLAAVLSIIAGVIHILVTPEHFGEWWGYGLFFLATVATQLLWAPMVIRWPRQMVLIAGIAGNAAIAAMWALSRSIGVPLFGPSVGEIEPVGALDVISTVAEIALVAMLALIVVSAMRQIRETPAPLTGGVAATSRTTL